MATKRSNPFIEDFMPQSKVHVGLKQFNSSEDRLREVYEKTLQLLFRGAKKLGQDNICIQDSVAQNKKDGLKQLVIGENGSLVATAAKVVAMAPMLQCSCGGALEVHCSYCESALCVTCQQFCTCCEKYHCSHCSLAGSEGNEVCLSCYK